MDMVTIAYLQNKIKTIPKGDKGDKGDPGEITQAEFDELAGDVGALKSAVDVCVIKVANETVTDLTSSISYTNGYYMNTSGNPVASQDYAYTEKISVNPGEIIFVNATRTYSYRFVTAFSGNTAQPDKGSSVSAGIWMYTVPDGIDGVVITINPSGFTISGEISKRVLSYNYENVYADQMTKILHKVSRNLLSIDDIIRGTLDYRGVLVESDTADYYVTGFIPAKKGQYIQYVINSVSSTIQRISLYNETKGFIENVNSQSNYKVTGETVAYVRLQLYKSVLNNVRTMVCVSDTSAIQEFEWPYKPYDIVVGARPRIDVKASDGMMPFWKTMQDAFYKGNCDVYINVGSYTYTNEIVDYIRNLNRRGVPIGNGCRYYFATGANLYCEYTGENVSDVKGFFSPLDSWNLASDYEIYNLNLVSKNTVYALHDEANGDEEFCRHIYRNCYIALDNSALGESGNDISKCIGGGLGLHSEIIIENCVFSTVNPLSPHGEDVSYHKANNQSYTDASIIITGCYFSGIFRADMNYGTVPNVVPRLIICNNSGRNFSAYQCDLKSWNNDIRS